MFKRIYNVYKNPEHPAHKSQIYGTVTTALLGCIIGLCFTFVFPMLQDHYKSVADNLKLKQESIQIFSKSLTQTMNYYRTMNEYKYLSDTSSDNKVKTDCALKSNEYYDRLVSIDPPYEVACTLIRMYFNGNIIKEIDEINKLLDLFLSTKYKILNSSNQLTDNPEFQVIEKQIYQSYDKIIKDMLTQLKQ